MNPVNIFSHKVIDGGVKASYVGHHVNRMCQIQFNEGLNIPIQTTFLVFFYEKCIMLISVLIKTVF